MKDKSDMRLRTLGAVCVSCAAASPSSASAADPAAPTVPPPGSSLGAPAVPVAVPGDPHAAVMRLLVDRHVWMKQRHVTLLGEHLSRQERRDLRERMLGLTPKQVRARTRALSRDIRALRRRVSSRYGGAPDVPIPGVLAAIARCESGGNPRAVSASGMYRGKYQFSFATWRAVGGEGDPASASETEQDRRAAILYRRHGPGQWPVCGR
jgi:soluble lytic murein transglycosylase-like protein